MAHSISNWQSQFLERRGLQCPTGMPLYSYLISKEEFDDLEEILKERVAAYLLLVNLNDISRNVPAFPALFVLYAAEWWRRRYDGTGWSWEPIVEALGASSEGWNQAQRSECVKKGLQDWRLRLTNTHGLRFLGSIAFQGGLPMQLLASARGNIGRVLGKVLRLAAVGHMEATDVQEWIRSLSAYLPQAYRQTEIYILLAEVILSVLRLKEAAKLTSANGALEALDRFDPQWRNYFPIPIEDAQAQGLIDQLIRDAAEAKLAKPTKRISVERRLEILDDGVWQIRSDIDLPEYIDVKDLVTLFAVEEPSLTRWLTLCFTRNDLSTEVGLRKLAGQERYRIERKSLDSRNETAASEHIMALMTSAGDVRHCSVTRGEELNADLPWIFEPIADSAKSFRFVRQGSGSLSGHEAVVCIPDDWKIQAETGGEANLVGHLPLQLRAVWKVKGSARVIESEDQYFRVRCGQVAMSEDRLEWRGSRIWEIFSRPEQAFYGVPRLYRVSEEGLAQQAQGDIAWRVPGGRRTVTPIGLAGPVDALWPAEGETKWRSRLVLLPDNASFQIEPGDNPSWGKFRFTNWGLLGVELETADVSLTIQHEGNDLVVLVEHQGSDSPPEWCELRLLWRENPNDARLRVPFPASGARAFDVNGRQLVDNLLIPTSGLCGIRLVGFLGKAHQAELRLRLQGGKESNRHPDITRTIKAPPGENRVAVRLIDYAQDIQRMLAGVDALDAAVSIRLKVGNGLSTRLRIARYACELERLANVSEVGLRQEDLSKLEPEDIFNLPVRALRLDAPGEEPIVLLPIQSEGVATGNWLFPEHLLSPGPWLIYPGVDSNLMFRPLLWPVPSEEDNQSSDPEAYLGLAEALKIPSEAPRREVLDDVLGVLASNFAHDDWQLVEQLAGHLGHLPLSTLDLWRRFSHSPEAMAAISIRVGTWQAGFIERFSSELPFMWEAISLGSWVNSMQMLHKQCEAWYGSEAGQVIFSSHLERRVQDMTSSSPALRALLEVAKSIVTGNASQEITLARQGFMDAVFAEQLFKSENCRLQQLLRNNAEAQWPSGFDTEIKQARRDGVANYLCQGNHSFHDPVINVPILLAIGAATNSPLDWSRDVSAIRDLRAIQNFDPEWFTEAYDLTVARCLANNDIPLQ